MPPAPPRSPPDTVVFRARVRRRWRIRAGDGCAETHCGRSCYGGCTHREGKEFLRAIKGVHRVAFLLTAVSRPTQRFSENSRCANSLTTPPLEVVRTSLGVMGMGGRSPT